VADYRVGNTLGQRIQAVRKARGIRTANALAELIGNGSVSLATLQNIETGRLTNVSVSQLLNIAFALKIPPAFLLAPLGRADGKVDLPNLSSGLAAMSSMEFDAWLAGADHGAYRSTSAAEITDRNELAARRELDALRRERARISTIADLEATSDRASSNQPEWDRSTTRLGEIEARITEITAYLNSAGWSIED
jgi:transcriptional regulator with XRE-family HTH domain